MTFVADESVERQIVDAVRALGYHVLSTAESAPGIVDEGVLSRANDAQSVLLTVITYLTQVAGLAWKTFWS